MSGISRSAIASARLRNRKRSRSSMAGTPRPIVLPVAATSLCNRSRSFLTLSGSRPDRPRRSAVSSDSSSSARSNVPERRRTALPSANFTTIWRRLNADSSDGVSGVLYGSYRASFSGRSMPPVSASRRNSAYSPSIFGAMKSCGMGASSSRCGSRNSGRSAGEIRDVSGAGWAGKLASHVIQAAASHRDAFGRRIVCLKLDI